MGGIVEPKRVSNPANTRLLRAEARRWLLFFVGVIKV